MAYLRVEHPHPLASSWGASEVCRRISAQLHLAQGGGECWLEREPAWNESRLRENAAYRFVARPHPILQAGNRHVLLPKHIHNWTRVGCREETACKLQASPGDATPLSLPSKARSQQNNPGRGADIGTFSLCHAGCCNR